MFSQKKKKKWIHSKLIYITIQKFVVNKINTFNKLERMHYIAQKTQ